MGVYVAIYSECRTNFTPLKVPKQFVKSKRLLNEPNLTKHKKLEIMKNSLLIYGVFAVMIFLTSFNNSNDIGGSKGVKGEMTYDIGGSKGVKGEMTYDIGGSKGVKGEMTYDIGGSKGVKGE
jgi:hypothetical protein